MSYIGSASFNGSSIFSETESSNTFFCTHYPMTYLRTKPCKVTIESINEIMKLFHGSYTGYQGTCKSMKAMLLILESLGSLIDGLYVDHLFNEDNFIGSIKMEDVGSDFSIRFYRPEEKDKTFLKLPEENMNLYKKLIEKPIPVVSINSIDLFCAFILFQGDKNLYESILRDLMNIQTRFDVLDLIDKINEIYTKRHQEYIEKYKATMSVTKYFDSISDAIKTGESIFVTYEKGNLYFFHNDEITEIKIDFFAVIELFKENGLTSFKSNLTINNKSEFKSFIDSFSKNNDRNLDLENKIQKLYESIKDGENFVFNIGGSF